MGARGYDVATAGEISRFTISLRPFRTIYSHVLCNDLLPTHPLAHFCIADYRPHVSRVACPYRR